jgi:DNA-binding response OmpR family regulator
MKRQGDGRASDLVIIGGKMAKPKLLVMDDEAMFGDFVESVATELGYEVQTLSQSGAFAGAYDAFQPDTIILDMVMPGMDGTEITRWLAEQKFAGKLIIVTGYNPQYSKIAKALGEIGGLHSVLRIGKPVRLEELRRVLRN